MAVGRPVAGSETVRVVQLANFQRARGGSFVPWLRGVLGEAGRRGWSPEAVFFEPPEEVPWLDELAEAGVKVHLAPSALMASRRGRRRWLGERLGDSTGPMVLHTHFTSWDVPALSAARRSEDGHVFWHVHTAISSSPLVVLRGMAKFGLLSRRVDRILCPAPNIVDGIRRQGAARDKVSFVPSALEVENFPLLGPADRASARDDLGLSPDAIVLLHFGWHTYLKGTDIFLDTVKLLSESRPDLDVVGVIRGNGEDAIELVNTLGIADRVRIQPPVPSILTLFGAADVLVSSSRMEGMAYAVLESLSCGTPVVATNIPGHAFLGDRLAACRVVERQPERLAAAIVETVGRSRDEAAGEATEARAWIAEHLSVDRIAAEIVSMYAAALGHDA